MVNKKSSDNQAINLSSGEIKCAKCQFSNPQGNKYCGRCGASLIVKCRRCGQINERSLRECSKCGSNLRGSFWRRWRRKLFDKQKDKLILILLVLVFSGLIAWLARRMCGDGQ